MKLIIELPEDRYNEIINDDYIPDGNFRRNCLQAIKNGTPLPKRHGRLIDEEKISLSGIHFETERDHAMMIGRLNSAPTIIEEDKESEESMSRCEYCVYRFSWYCDDGYNRVSNSCMCDDFKLDFDCLNDEQKKTIQEILIAERVIE